VQVRRNALAAARHGRGPRDCGRSRHHEREWRTLRDRLESDLERADPPSTRRRIPGGEHEQASRATSMAEVVIEIDWRE